MIEGYVLGKVGIQSRRPVRGDSQQRVEPIYYRTICQ